MTTRNLFRAHNGITLIEMLAYIAIGYIVLAMAASVMLNTVQLTDNGMRTLGVEQALNDVQEQLVRDVRSGYEFPNELLKYQAGEGTLLVLRRSDSGSEQCIVYDAMPGDQALLRLVFERKAENWQPIAVKQFPMKLLAARFSVSGESARAEIVPVYRDKNSLFRRENVRSITASLRCAK